MRFRSQLTLLLLTVFSVSVLGCGSSGGGFFPPEPDTQNQTGDLVFNFETVTAQAFIVEDDTERLRFDFYQTEVTDGDPDLTRTVDFAPSVTLSEIPVAMSSVRITALAAGGIPTAVFSQAIQVRPLETVVVPAVGNPTPVVLDDLAFVPAAIANPNNALDRVELPVGGTGQVYMLAFFSNGDAVILGDQATYLLDPNDPNASNILEVGERGQLRGLSEGETTLLGQYGGQTLSIPVLVGTSGGGDQPGPGPGPGPEPGPIDPPEPNGNTGTLSFQGTNTPNPDYIAGGQSWNYSDANALFVATPVVDEGEVRGVTISVNGFNGAGPVSEDNWTVSFSAPDGEALEVQDYGNATRHPFNVTTPGLSLSGNGRGCNTLTGNFTVTSLTVGTDEEDNPVITEFSATFLQNCEGNEDNRVTGEVTFAVVE